MEWKRSGTEVEQIPLIREIITADIVHGTVSFRLAPIVAGTD
jgi:hypothetical protein